MQRFYLVLSAATLITACSPTDSPAQGKRTTSVDLATATQDKGRTPGQETNCPPAKWIDTESLQQPQRDVLFKIADFSMDGQVTREEFDRNPRYAEIALFGAEFLSRAERGLKDIIDVTATPPISVKNALKLSVKLTSERGTGSARSGLMGSLQAKTKTCFFMVKNGLE